MDFVKLAISSRHKGLKLLWMLLGQNGRLSSQTLAMVAGLHSEALMQRENAGRKDALISTKFAEAIRPREIG